jgi:hypothetical protein
MVLYLTQVGLEGGYRYGFHLRPAKEYGTGTGRMLPIGYRHTMSYLWISQRLRSFFMVNLTNS